MLTVAVALALQSSLAPSTLDDARAIWRVAVEEVRHKRQGRPILLLATTAGACQSPPDFPCFILRDPLTVAPDVTDDERQRLGAALAQPPATVDGLGLPNVVPISRADFDAIERATDNDPGGFWTAFYRRYPESAGWVALSVPAFDDTRETAWLLMDHVYGNLGAEGWLLRLRRGRHGWTLDRKWLLWQS